ncbi:Gfo/Idh/MocA family oxidoreductase [Microbacterium oryzae]|uniref:Gfo/Idh/MocA family protein n=1 Tax=Microbacterium oryzae TaxID=743009 RepID=UPI0025B280A4|nr:Gfo/Idh/MocA family oxidoreductase [Microbacterium oryzae]MDN3311711.1 Gfo/Idh/MocA family oxidoreductase [Microbacterium oryzae]
MNDDRPVIGMIGAGMISRAHMPGLQRLAREVLIYSVEGAEDVAETYGGTVVATFEELLERSDIVDIVTPTFTHYDLVRRCLLAGKDVIVEKPIALTQEQATEVVRLAHDLGRRLFPAHVVRYSAPYALAKEAVDAGEIGEVAVMRFSRSGSFPTRTPWFADAEKSGGVLMDLTIHDVDVARWIAGDIVQVYATLRRAGTPEQPMESAHVLLTHVSGAITHCAGLWGPAHLPFETEFSISGTGGTLAHSSRAESAVVSTVAADDLDAGLMPVVDPQEDPYGLELADFVAGIRGRRETRVTAEDGLDAVRVVSAAWESVRSGQPVTLAPTMSTTARSAT